MNKRKYARRGATIQERLALYTHVTPCGCWVWTGSRNQGEYGHLRIGPDTVATHRAAWEASFGPIPPGMLVCHRCDNPPCINPDHLFLGDAKANADDMMGKGRGGKARGRGVASAKLTAELIRAIRAEPGVKLRVLAARYGVSMSAISYIRRGIWWRHVDAGPPANLQGG